MRTENDGTDKKLINHTKIKSTYIESIQCGDCLPIRSGTCKLVGEIMFGIMHCRRRAQKYHKDQDTDALYMPYHLYIRNHDRIPLFLLLEKGIATKIKYF